MALEAGLAGRGFSSWYESLEPPLYSHLRNEQEGLVTIIMGIAGFLVVPSTPRESRFLTDNQKEYVYDFPVSFLL